jgi:hypothetical protein
MIGKRETRSRPRTKSAEDAGFVTRLISLKPEIAVAFDILKAKQGPRSGPRLVGEAMEMLLERYGEKPAPLPERPSAAGEPGARKDTTP